LSPAGIDKIIHNFKLVAGDSDVRGRVHILTYDLGFL
jgi:hypothetical protein